MYEDCKNCLQAFQLENKMNFLEIYNMTKIL